MGGRKDKIVADPPNWALVNRVAASGPIRGGWFVRADP